MAGVAAQHDHPAVRGAYGTDGGSRRVPRTPDGSHRPALKLRAIITRPGGRMIIHKMLRAAVAVAVLAGAVAGASTAAGAAGRYKKDGNKCVWDAKDTGPNQCTPAVEGRFKKEGNACVWSAGDKGADQCRPEKGRFKKEGSACVWSATDSGPNQCDPRAAK